MAVFAPSWHVIRECIAGLSVKAHSTLNQAAQNASPETGRHKQQWGIVQFLRKKKNICLAKNRFHNLNKSCHKPIKILTNCCVVQFTLE